MEYEGLCEECGSRLFDKCDNCSRTFPDKSREVDGWMLISMAFDDVEDVGFNDCLLCPKCVHEKFTDKSLKEIRKTISED